MNTQRNTHTARRLGALITAASLLATPLLAQVPTDLRPAAETIPASDYMVREHGVVYYQAQVIDSTTSVIQAYDGTGNFVGELYVDQGHEGFELGFTNDQANWNAKVGFSFMHDTRDGMFITAMYDLSLQQGQSKRESFVYLSDWLGEEQLNVTYVLNGQPFRTDIGSVTPEVQQAYLDAYYNSGADGMFENRHNTLAIDILSDSNINQSLPFFLRGLGSPRIDVKHDAASTTTSCAVAAVCAVAAWGGAVACAGCAAASFNCGWGLGEATSG